MSLNEKNSGSTMALGSEELALLSVQNELVFKQAELQPQVNLSFGYGEESQQTYSFRDYQEPQLSFTFNNEINSFTNNPVFPTSNFTPNSSYLNSYKTTSQDIQNYSCELCQKNFTKKHLLETHRRSHSSSSSSKPYVCNICYTSFSRSHDLKRHEYIHSDVKPFSCPVCSRGFSRR
jgi:uncharacterized Zn-finger protein